MPRSQPINFKRVCKQWRVIVNNGFGFSVDRDLAGELLDYIEKQDKIIQAAKDWKLAQEAVFIEECSSDNNLELRELWKKEEEAEELFWKGLDEDLDTRNR